MRLLALAALAALGSVVLAGPYTDLGLAATDARIKGWATGFQDLVRGPMRLDNPAFGLASFGTGEAALGAATGNSDSLVSLGDGGSITLTFAAPLTDGDGTDFAVFENGFLVQGLVFAELAHVEVSSNGVDFVRFPSISLTPTTTQLGGFATLNPTNLKNLAGKHVANQGTQFDLSEVAGLSPRVDVRAITRVRLVDVVGSIDPRYGSVDSLGNLINDPWPTPFASSGFDLDAVAAVNVVPEPATLLALSLGLAALARRRR